MARNVEIKARVQNVERTQRLVAGLADRGPETLKQTDTFFKVEVGRLKLREFSDGAAELIFYRRPDALGPTESSYERVPVSDAPELRELLASALGACGEVHKKRHVYWAGRTRIHLDEVRNLGNFLELEVVLEAEEPAEAGVSEVLELKRMLEIHEDSLLADAYVDLLHNERLRTQT